MSLLALGTVAFDDIETPFGKAEMVVGGAALYAAMAASHYTSDIRISSIIGEDFPDEELSFLKSRGVDLQGIKIIEGGKSFFWSGKYHADMNSRDTLVTDLNVLADFDPVLPDSYKDSKYIMLGNLTPSIQMQVLDQLVGNQELIALDTMNFWMDTAMDSLKEVIARIDVLIINDEEARQLSDEYSLLKAARKILDMGPRYLVVKKGEHGALLFSRDDIFFVPAMPLLEVKDPTGAGDTFAGGFMGYLAKTEDTSFDNIKRALVHGSTMASFCVEDFSVEAMRDLTTHKIRQRATEFKQLVHYDFLPI